LYTGWPVGPLGGLARKEDKISEYLFTGQRGNGPTFALCAHYNPQERATIAPDMRI
jgi:hypothetical protein